MPATAPTTPAQTSLAQDQAEGPAQRQQSVEMIDGKSSKHSIATPVARTMLSYGRPRASSYFSASSDDDEEQHSPEPPADTVEAGIDIDGTDVEVLKPTGDDNVEQTSDTQSQRHSNVDDGFEIESAVPTPLRVGRGESGVKSKGSSTSADECDGQSTQISDDSEENTEAQGLSETSTEEPSQTSESEADGERSPGVDGDRRDTTKSADWDHEEVNDKIRTPLVELPIPGSADYGGQGTALVGERLQKGLRSLWTSTSFSDVTIICGRQTSPVHCCILVSQCAYFADACRNKLIHTGNGDILDMSFEDPTALRSLLLFFYTGSLAVPYDDLMILGGLAIPSIDALRKVYSLAVKYGLPDLKALAEQQYCDALANKWPKGHGMLLAKALIEIFSPKWKDAQRLREVTLVVAVRHSEELVGDVVIYDWLQGEPLRALVLRLSRDLYAGQI